MKYQAYIYLAFHFVLANINIEIINNLNYKKSQVVAQQPRVGLIFSIKGKVWIDKESDSKLKEAREYDALFDGDILQLGAGASIIVKCDNGKSFPVTSKRWSARGCNSQLRVRSLATTNGVYNFGGGSPGSLPNAFNGVYNFGGASLPNALNIGDKGFLVRRLQENLRQLGFLPVNPTGTFGPATRDAVANFQRSNRLIPNGIADSQTLALISQALITSNNPNNGWNNNDCNTARGEICLGERSQRVIVLQQQLQQWGFFRANTDGYYGAATRDAVFQFQRNAGLNATGFVDYQTWLALGFNNSTSQDYSQGYNYHQKPNYVQPIYAGYSGYSIQLPNSLPPTIIFPPLPPPTTSPPRGNYNP